ncbi:MAG: efflux RND transporter periplasmic adaptor subunit [Clostridia bacterium]|jgi:RND family efflux transporter MFP subunit|nr:efflux RND transporter periplasmic adaptor subunit [Clostridiaceae bacterium]
MFRVPRTVVKNARFIRSIALGIIIFIMSLSATGCFLWPVEEEMPKPPLVQPDEVQLPLRTVVRGPIEESIRGTATYTPSIYEAVVLKNQAGKVVRIHIKEGDYVNQGDLLLELDSTDLEDQLYYQRIAHERAQIAYDRLLERWEIQGGGDKYDLRLAEINLEVETKKLNELEEKYRKTRVFAPMSGQINYMRRLKPDDVIADGTTLCQISDPDSGVLEYNNTTYAHYFTLGTKVQVSYTKNKQLYEYECEVIGPTANQPEDSNKKGVVTIDATGLQNLEFGDRVQIKLVLNYNENAVLVPRSVLRENQGAYFVYVYENGMRTQRLVEVGIMTTTEAEIVAGLEPGEQVFTR